MASVPANSVARKFGLAELWIGLVVVALLLTMSLPIPSVRLSSSQVHAASR